MVLLKYVQKPGTFFLLLKMKHKLNEETTGERWNKQNSEHLEDVKTINKVVNDKKQKVPVVKHWHKQKVASSSN